MEKRINQQTRRGIKFERGEGEGQEKSLLSLACKLKTELTLDKCDASIRNSGQICCTHSINAFLSISLLFVESLSANYTLELVLRRTENIPSC